MEKNIYADYKSERWKIITTPYCGYTAGFLIFDDLTDTW